MEILNLLKALLGAAGLVSAAITIWYLDKENHGFEETLSMKISLATLVFSVMMFTPLIDRDVGFMKLGFLTLPSLKLISDTIIMSFMASSLKDLLERERQKD